MAVDEALLFRHRSHRDREAGIEEEFLQPTLGSGSTVAILSRPLNRSRDTGWVVCHSFGMEQIYLGRLDVGIARALSGAGFPVLRFHCQGYGDSERGMEEVRLSSHLADARDAVSLLAEREGVERVGVIGARFGGMVAALLADRHELPLLAMVEPITNGLNFMRDFLRTRVFSEMVGASENGHASGMQRLRQQLTDRGWIDVKGFLLSSRAYEEISAIHLSRELRAFGGSALVLGVSRTGRIGVGLQQLSARLLELGARCEQTVVEHRMAAGFGQHHHRNEAGERKTDTQFEVYQAVTSQVVAWARRQGDPREHWEGPA